MIFLLQLFLLVKLIRVAQSEREMLPGAQVACTFEWSARTNKKKKERKLKKKSLTCIYSATRRRWLNAINPNVFDKRTPLRTISQGSVDLLPLWGGLVYFMPCQFSRQCFEHTSVAAYFAQKMRPLSNAYPRLRS